MTSHELTGTKRRVSPGTENISNSKAPLTRIRCSWRDHHDSELFVAALFLAAMLQ